MSPSGRPDRDDWEMDGALWLARMGDCTRRQVGALIVGPDKRFWGMGYNGAYPGGPSCMEGACPRGQHYRTDGGDGSCVVDWHRHHSPSGISPPLDTCRYDDMCACGQDWPCPDAVAPGSSYDTGPGACISTHAEGNAKADALRRGGGDLSGCRMVVSCEPCEGCVRDLRNTTRLEFIRWPGGVVALP